ncbi:hypothetical protein SME22J_45410 [Serratia marcescens]|nr:hypothetical protein SME22J_45410 [Serratia marcescens]
MSGAIINWLKRTFFLSSIMSMSVFVPVASSSPWELETGVNPKGSPWNVSAKITSWDIYNTAPNPLYNCQVCTLYILFADGWGIKRPEMAIYVPNQARGIKTLGELGEFFIRRGDFNRTYTQQLIGGGAGELCFFLGYPNQGEGGPSYWSIPGGKRFCQVQIVPTYCDFYLASTELRHGVLSPDKTNGNTARASLNVQCSANLRVRIMSADRSSSIFFNGVSGFRSDLQVDGMKIGEGAVVTATPAGVSLNLTSTLAGYDGSVGTFRGSKTIIIALP